MDVITNNILPFALIIVGLVVVHELGHFITAKLCGVQVLEFGIGYPPRLFGVKYGETEYTINLLPLGGFVRLLGEEDPSHPRSLAAQPALQRLIVMGSGSFMNFVFAVILFAGALMIPREVPVGQAVVAQVVPDSPAARAGLRPGDIIQEIGGREIASFAEVRYNLDLNRGENTPVVVRRTDSVTGQVYEETIYVRPRWAPPDIVYQIQPGDNVDTVAKNTGFSRTQVRLAAGIETTIPKGKQLTIVDQYGETIYYTPEYTDTVENVARSRRVSEDAVAAAAGLPDQSRLDPGKEISFPQGATGIVLSAQYGFTETRSLGPWDALQRGWRSTFDVIKLTRNAIIGWVKGGPAPFSGPIGIAQATGEVVKEAGWKSLVDMAASISISLALLNVLPLPMLDGGRMAFVVIEILRRGRRIAPAKEAMVHFVGMMALLLLVVILSYFDIARIVRGDSLFR